MLPFCCIPVANRWRMFEFMLNSDEIRDLIVVNFRNENPTLEAFVKKLHEYCRYKYGIAFGGKYAGKEKDNVGYKSVSWKDFFAETTNQWDSIWRKYQLSSRLLGQEEEVETSFREDDEKNYVKT